MHKPSTYLVITLFSYLSTYIRDLFLTELVTKVKPNINSVEVHPQLSNDGHPVDGKVKPKAAGFTGIRACCIRHSVVQA
jgi:hypothetical protein